jgi:hypothetical protein
VIVATTNPIHSGQTVSVNARVGTLKSMVSAKFLPHHQQPHHPATLPHSLILNNSDVCPALVGVSAARPAMSAPVASQDSTLISPLLSVLRPVEMQRDSRFLVMMETTSMVMDAVVTVKLKLALTVPEAHLTPRIHAAKHSPKN